MFLQKYSPCVQKIALDKFIHMEYVERNGFIFNELFGRHLTSILILNFENNNIWCCEKALTLEWGFTCKYFCSAVRIS
jgi:hypothetical protein